MVSSAVQSETLGNLTHLSCGLVSTPMQWYDDRQEWGTPDKYHFLPDAMFFDKPDLQVSWWVSEHQPRMKCEILMKVDDWKEKGHGALQQLVPFRQIMKIPKDVKSVQIHSNPLKQFVPLTFPYQVYLLDPYLPINFHQIHLPWNFPSMFP